MGKKADDFAWFDRDSNSLFFNFEPHYTELTDSNCNVFCTSISEYFQSKISGRDTFYGLKKTIENESGMILKQGRLVNAVMYIQIHTPRKKKTFVIVHAEN